MTISTFPSTPPLAPWGGRPHPPTAILVVHPLGARGNGAALHLNVPGIGDEFDAVTAAQLEEIIANHGGDLPGVHATAIGEDDRDPRLPARHAAAIDWAAGVGYRTVGYWFTTVGYCGPTVVRHGEFATSDDDARRTAFDFILAVDAKTEWQLVDYDSDDEVIRPANDEAIALSLATLWGESVIFLDGDDELVPDPAARAVDDMRWAVLHPSPLRGPGRGMGVGSSLGALSAPAPRRPAPGRR